MVQARKVRTSFVVSFIAYISRQFLKGQVPTDSRTGFNDQIRRNQLVIVNLDSSGATRRSKDAPVPTEGYRIHNIIQIKSHSLVHGGHVKNTHNPGRRRSQQASIGAIGYHRHWTLVRYVGNFPSGGPFKYCESIVVGRGHKAIIWAKDERMNFRLDG